MLPLFAVSIIHEHCINRAVSNNGRILIVYSAPELEVAGTQCIHTNDYRGSRMFRAPQMAAKIHVLWPLLLHLRTDDRNEEDN